MCFRCVVCGSMEIDNLCGKAAKVIKKILASAPRSEVQFPRVDRGHTALPNAAAVCYFHGKLQTG